MRFIFFIQQLFLSLQRIHHKALALTTYDKFLNLSDGMHFSTQQIITSNLELYHILIIEKRFPEWANHTMSQKSHDSSRHSCGTTCKKLHFTYLFFYQTTRSFAAVVLSQVEISLLNEQASKKLTRLVTATKILKQSIVKMPPAAQSSIPRLVRTTALLRGIITRKKSPEY